MTNPNMQDVLASIVDFNLNVVQIGVRPLKALERSEKNWLVSALEEEARELADVDSIHLEETFAKLRGVPGFDTEYSTAVTQARLVTQVDALLDSVIFSFGGLLRQGVTMDQAVQCLAAIMEANHLKKAGVKAGRTGAPDAVKPEDWVGPEVRIFQILFGDAEKLDG